MIQRAGLGFLYHGAGLRGLLHPWQRQWSWQCNKNKHMQAGSLFGWEWWLACCLSQPNKSPYRAERWASLISSASRLMPLTECRRSDPWFIMNRGGEKFFTVVKLKWRERVGEGYSGTCKEREGGRKWNKKGEKINILKSRGQREIMQKYREQTERFSRENMEALAWGNAINKK